MNKKIIFYATTLLIVFSSSVFAELYEKAPIKPRIVGQTCTVAGEGHNTHVVDGIFDCGELGKDLTVVEIYEKGYRVIQMIPVTYTVANGIGGFRNITDWTILIEKQD